MNEGGSQYKECSSGYVQFSLMSNRFFRSVSYVLCGTFSAQLIPIAGTLCLSRIFAPTEYGLYSEWLGIVFFLGVVVSCRFEMSLAVEDDGEPRRLSVAMTLITILIVSLIATFLIIILSRSGLEILKRLPLVLVVSIVPAAALIAASQTLQNWAAADGRYSHLFIARMSQSISVVALQVGIGFFKPNAVGLGLGYFIGMFVAFCVNLIVKPIKFEEFSATRAHLFGFWRKQRQFPIYALPADSVSALTAQLPVLIVASRFGPESAGLLSMALRMVGAPLSILSNSVLDVFKRHGSAAYRERGECRIEYLQAFRMLVIVAVISTAAILTLTQPLFGLFFNQNWLGAAPIIVWLLPKFAFGFVASPLSYMVYVAGKQRLDLIWQLASLSVTVATLFFVLQFHRALFAYSFCYAILYIIYLFMSLRFSRGIVK